MTILHHLGIWLTLVLWSICLWCGFRLYINGTLRESPYERYERELREAQEELKKMPFTAVDGSPRRG